MTALAWADGGLVAVFGASTVARYERAMFVPRKRASAQAPEPPASADNTRTSERAYSGPAPIAHPRALDQAAVEAAMLRYAQGDNSAFADVYAQLAPRLHGFCVRLCAGRPEADDLLQETLLKLHRSRSAYRPEANPLHWAFAIARCAYIDRLRRRKARPEVLGDGPSGIAADRAGSEPESELRAAQLRELVQSVLLAQPEAARTSYILVRLEGVSVADAAAILSASTMRSSSACTASPRPCENSSNVEVSMSTRKLDPKPSAAEGGDDSWLADVLARPGPPPDPMQFSELQSELAKPDRSSRRWPILFAIPIGGLAIVAARAWLGERSFWRIDLGNLGERLSWGIAALALCAAVAIAANLYRGRTGFGLATRTLSALALGLSALVAAIPLLLKGTSPQPALHALGAPCATVVLGAGALTLAAAAFLFHRTQPIAAQARALVLGTAAAAWTGIIISLHCPAESSTHLLWGHSAPLLILVALAAWLLPRQLQP